MNIYVAIRILLHSLLFVDNCFALTGAAWSISSGHEPSPGAVLVILGSIAYVLLLTAAWAEACMPGIRLSRIRTEAALVPMLAMFQLLSAAIVTSNAVKSVCGDPTACVTLLIFSWMAPFTLIMYYLVMLVVIWQHRKADPNIWDASPLEYPWFSNSLPPPPPPPKDGNVQSRRGAGSSSSSVQPSTVRHQHISRFSWMTASFHLPSPPAHVDSPKSSIRSFGLPKWAKELRPIIRGLELPFPVLHKSSVKQAAAAPTRSVNAPHLDAPVSPVYYYAE